MDADCIVLGAGFAGLAAADRLSRAGRRVVVLEARDRVGGRTATVTLPGGGWVDVGGQWIGPTQDRMYELCRRFDRRVYAMHAAGDHQLRLGGVAKRYRGNIPYRVGPLALANLGWVMVRLEQLARTVPLERPWAAPQARSFDQQTLGDWMRRNIPSREAQTLFEVGVEAVFAAEPDELSLLHALFYMHSGGSFDRLTRSAGGAQQDRIDGGVQPLAEALAGAVVEQGGQVLLGAPVERVVQGEEGATVCTAAGEVRGRRVVSTLPPPLLGEVTFEPALCFERCELVRRIPMGAVIKCVAAYERPFWRDAGWSGQGVADEGPIRAVFDASPRNERPALLMGFVEGAEARRLARASTQERRQLALDTFARFFGDEARRPLAYVDRAWTEEPFSRGCYAALFPPGVWTRFGHVIRRPEGRIHWAGTETATHWNGYIEGAVRSGLRAAEEVLARV